MKTDSPVIRPATADDAEQVIELISFADENALLYLTGKSDLQEAKAVYRRGFCREDVYYSYLFTQACFIEGHLAGCILAFPGYLEPTFIAETDSTLPLVREAEDDELYIDSLSVYPAFRGQGLSRYLIDATKTQALRYQLSKLSLLADDTKPHLEKMYARYGFITEKEITLNGVVHKKMALCVRG
ncbi:GNAT family N-acetyltransferase [Rouxiella badensis]|uniref:GNAT family N-acetyltransferase n=1 Tax=Rouxiella badensis TaxID=1646377 RepID=UPI0022AB216E|nr:GNAT family N-acetyltransferase [Rouxiella badensis]WAT10908.1 GNAT family N-acetyltransferase [Rouxiella badensis]